MGSGKSTVARMLNENGAVIIDADVLAREALRPGEPAYQLVLTEFGDEILSETGEIDRQALARQVFSDAAKRDALERIVHPVVAARRADLLAKAPDGSVVIEDVPLLVEKSLHPEYDFVIVVAAPQSLRLSRLMSERNVSEAEARSRMSAQASDEAREAVADVIIENSGTKAELAKRVKEVWLQLQRLTSNR